jgi:hypothetical protein
MGIVIDNTISQLRIICKLVFKRKKVSALLSEWYKSLNQYSLAYCIYNTLDVPQALKNTHISNNRNTLRKIKVE